MKEDKTNTAVADPAKPSDASSADSTSLATQQAAQEPMQSKVPLRMGIAPSTIEEAWRMAQYMSSSEMVPKQYRNKPADVLVAIQYGMELGFPPMQALQSIAVINGRPSVWGDGFLALIMASPLYRDHDEHYEVGGERRDTISLEDLKKDDTAALCTFWRQGKQLPVTRRFSVAQAKKASLLGKEGPWSTYPDRMMAMRARGFAGRDAFPDLLRGIRTAEEALDTPPSEDLDIKPVPQPQQPRRASEARTSTPQASAPAAAATDDTPALAATNEPSQELRGLKVTHTGFVRPKSGEPYYQVEMTTTTGAKREFLTRDEQVYKEAASFEGTDHLVVAGYHKGKKDTTDVLVLDRLGIYEGGAQQAPAGELFS